MGRNHVSPVELLKKATANGYKQGAHQEEDSKRDNTKYVKKTLRDQDIALGRYEKWVAAVGKKEQGTEEALFGDDSAVDASYIMEARSLRQDLPPLDLATIKDFLRFIVATSRGIIDDGQKKVTVDSMNTFAEWFFAGFARVTGNRIDEENRCAVYDWTRNILTKEGLVVNKKKPKHLFGEKELVHFTNTFWTVDDAQFTHPRNKVQIPFAIAVFCWTGARIGAFFPAKENKHTGGLRYRDIDLVLKRIPSGGWKVIYRINQRWVKNNRDPENTVYGASTSQHSKLLYDDTQYLLALALADNAVWGIDSFEDLWQLQIPPGEDELILRWNDSAEALPILRNATMQHGVTEEPLPKRTFDRTLKSVLNHSGYFGNATVHAIRRYLGKKVNGRYTEVERSQHINQSDPRVYGQSYVANTSSVDGRSAFLNEPAQHDHVAYFQSFATLLEKGLPRRLPAHKEQAIRRDSQLLEFETNVHQLKRRNATASQIKAAESKARGYRASLTKKSLQQYKLEWVRQRRDWKVTTRGKERPNDDENTDLLEILSRVMPERGRLTRTMISDKVVSEEERRQAIEDLCSLASQDCTILYRPGEKPVEGVCPVEGCAMKMMSLRKPQRSTHIHNCRRKQLACTLERLHSELKYCFACFDWFVEDEWDQHCQTHLKSITSKRCGSITHCHTLFRPAFCPFCMGDNRLSASLRWCSWTREAKLWSHLESHLEASGWPLKCPHPLCSLHLNDETLFLYHLSDVHSLRMSPHMNKCRPISRNSEPLINWTSDTASHKRKRWDRDEQKLRPSKRNKGPPKIDWSNEPSPRHSIDRVSSDGIQTASPHMLFKVSFTDTSTSDTSHVLPELTHSGSTSPPESDHLSLMNDFDPGQIIQHKDLRNELEWPKDSPETTSDEYKLLMQCEDAFFSQYLRSRSPSCSSTKSFDDNNDESIHSHMMTPSNICLSEEENPHLTDSIDQNTVKTKDVPVKAKKPRITLRIRQPDPRPKPKVLLRLSQPKQALPENSVRRVKPDVNDRRRRRT